MKVSTARPTFAGPVLDAGTAIVSGSHDLFRCGIDADTISVSRGGQYLRSMPGRQSLSRIAWCRVLCLALGACSNADGGEPQGQVCGPSERTTLFAEKLTRLVPSTPFEVVAGQEAWVSVVADADFNPSMLFPSVATLFLIDAGAEPRIREDTNNLPIIDDPAIPFDAEGEWRLATDTPGAYQVWSRRGPEIEVAACPTPASSDQLSASEPPRDTGPPPRRNAR